jgi:protein-arginine kinase activator protein McsA
MNNKIEQIMCSCSVCNMTHSDFSHENGRIRCNKCEKYANKVLVSFNVMITDVNIVNIKQTTK